MAILIIPAGGRASRMGSQPPEFSKPMLPIDGVPIIGRTVAAAGALPVRIITRPDDHVLHTWARDTSATTGSAIELVPAPFEPYPVTVLRGLADAREAVVVDGDVAASDDLEAFFAQAGTNANGTDITVATTTVPQAFGTGTIWWSATEGIGRTVARHDARLAGTYWLRPAATAALRRFVDAGNTSFHAFLSGYDQARIDAFPISYAYNVNDPATLRDARISIGARALEVGEVVLRTWRDDDVDALAGLLADPGFSWHPYRGARTREAAEEIVANAVEQWAVHHVGRYAVVDADGALLGYAGLGELTWPDRAGGWDFGIRLAAGAHGRGIGRRASEAAIADAFTRVGVELVVATVEEGHDSVLRMLHHLGFVQTDVLKHPRFGTRHVVLDMDRARWSALSQAGVREAAA